jgi:hypothetical protein
MTTCLSECLVGLFFLGLPDYFVGLLFLDIFIETVAVVSAYFCKCFWPAFVAYPLWMVTWTRQYVGFPMSF